MKKTRLAILLLMIILVVVLWYALFAKNTVYEWIISLGFIIRDGPWGMATFVLLSALSAMLSPFSTVPLVPVAIVIWGPFFTSLMLLAGWLIGGMLSYAIGWKFGYALVSLFIPHEKIDKWSKQIEKKVSIFLVLLFRTMTPSETGYIFGIIKYPFWSFVLVTLLSEIPYAFAISYAGNAILENEQQIFWLLAIASLAFLGIVYQAYRREFRKLS
jgi:uncharacterized membrane protein YdjX (TVP38/TMEM64 family)